jgi:hypothetical protein
VWEGVALVWGTLDKQDAGDVDNAGDCEPEGTPPAAPALRLVTLDLDDHAAYASMLAGLPRGIAGAGRWLTHAAPTPTPLEQGWLRKLGGQQGGGSADGRAIQVAIQHGGCDAADEVATAMQLDLIFSDRQQRDGASALQVQEDPLDLAGRQIVACRVEQHSNVATGHGASAVQTKVSDDQEDMLV